MHHDRFSIGDNFSLLVYVGCPEGQDDVFVFVSVERRRHKRENVID
jgi:hypothetical protein